MKLLVRAPMIENDLDNLKSVFDEVIYDPWTTTGERYYEDKMLEKLLELKPDGLITELDHITEKVLNGYQELKFIGDCRATPENIDVEACTRYNVPLFNTAGRNAQAVAELWISTVIAYLRNLEPSIQWLNDKKWIKGTTPYYLFRGNELYSKRVGFIGMGAVSHKILNILKVFECEVWYFDPFVKNQPEGSKEKTLEEIFSGCDIVTAHLPSNESTKEMLNEKLFSLMKENAIFVNSSRSSVVKTKALFNILKERKIKGAIIDVFDEEPPTDGVIKFSELDNVLLTPHIYGATFEVVDHQSKIVTNKVIKFMNGEDYASFVYNKKLLPK